MINLFKNVTTPKVYKTIVIVDWLELIQFGVVSEDETKKQAQQAIVNKIKYIRTSANTEEINEIKKTLPCVTYSFLYDNYKKDVNIVGSTGYIFYDVDSEINCDINKDKIYAMYRSCGGGGWHIIAKVKGLTKQNFLSSYKQIAEEIGINNIIDKNAAKASQFAIISYDNNMYLNSQSFVFEIDFDFLNKTQKRDTTLTTQEDSKKGHYSNYPENKKRDTTLTTQEDSKKGHYSNYPENKKRDTTLTTCDNEILNSKHYTKDYGSIDDKGDSLFFNLSDSNEREKRDTTLTTQKEYKRIRSSSVPFLNKIKYRVELDDYNGEDCVYIPEGKEYYETFLLFQKDGTTKKIKVGHRNKVLSAYLHNLICLNPHMSKEYAFTLMNDINKHCQVELDEREIKKLVIYKFKKNEEEKLEPIGVKHKKYWVNPKSSNKKEAYFNKRKEPAVQGLQEFFGDEILNTDTKVTYKTIAAFCGVSEKTIKRHITEEMKIIIKKQNDLVTKNKNQRNNT